jgi:hypothetical protein
MKDINLKYDKITGALITIDTEHHEIHEEEHFFYTDFNTVGSTSSVDYVFVTPHDRFIHMTFNATGSAITQVELFENSDKLGTTPQVIYNSYRSSDKQSRSSLYKTSTGGTTDGIRIIGMKSGSAQGASRSGMSTERHSEKVFKPNTTYIFRITSGTADNLCNLQLEWYEEKT